VERARTIISGGIEAKDPDLRVQAIVAASMVGRNEAVIKGLKTMLQDNDVPVRIAAISALADFESHGAKKLWPPCIIASGHIER